MRKINKITNIALIFTLIGVFLWQTPVWSGETCLRVPSSFQDGKQDFSEKFNAIASLREKTYYYGPGSGYCDKFINVSSKLVQVIRINKQYNIELILGIETIKDSFEGKRNVSVFNLGSGSHPLLSFNKDGVEYEVKNIDADFPYESWRPSKYAERSKANFEKKQIIEIEERCSVAIWDDLLHFIQRYADKASMWKDIEGNEEEKQRQVLLRNLQHTWEIIENGGYFVIIGSSIENFYPDDTYRIITNELNFDISEIHVIGESIDKARAIILKKRGTKEDSASLPAQKILEGPFQVPGTDVFYKVYETQNPAEIEKTLDKWFAANKEHYFERGEWNILIKLFILDNTHPNGFFVKLESKEGEVLGMGFFYKANGFMFSQDIEKAEEDIATTYFLDLMEVSSEYKDVGLGETLAAKVAEKSMNDPDVTERIFLTKPAPNKGRKKGADNFFEKIGAVPFHITRELLEDVDREEDDKAKRSYHRILYRPQAEELLRKVLNNTQVNFALPERISIQNEAVQTSL